MSLVGRRDRCLQPKVYVSDPATCHWGPVARFRSGEDFSRSCGALARAGGSHSCAETESDLSRRAGMVGRNEESDLLGSGIFMVSEAAQMFAGFRELARRADHVARTCGEAQVLIEPSFSGGRFPLIVQGLPTIERRRPCVSGRQGSAHAARLVLGFDAEMALSTVRRA